MGLRLGYPILYLFIYLFTVYFLLFFNNWNYVASNERAISEDEMERIWKEAVVA
jgi:hypothetical protein